MTSPEATTLVGYILLFVAIGAFFLFFHLLLGKLIRPAKPDREKLTIYECGEPTIGSAWIQFDLRFYVVALLFVIFDVEVAFFFPWAVVFGQANTIARAPEMEVASEQVAEAELLGGRRFGDLPEREQLQAAEAARSFAWIALVDILVFFGVLLVGFAYLWKRGDLDWVRSLAAEQAARAEPGRGPPPADAALVGAGSEVYAR